MNVGFQYTVEVMPTCLRGQGIALVNVMSMVSQMASPYIVYSVRIRVQRTDCHNHNNISVRHIREGSLPHHRSPLRPRGHSQPLPPGDSWPQDAGLSRGHQRVREVSYQLETSGFWFVLFKAWQIFLDAALQGEEEIQEKFSRKLPSYFFSRWEQRI